MTRTSTSRLLRLLTIPAGLALAVGCTYVTQSDYEARKDEIDFDKDGAPLGGPNKDCDDNDASRTPGAEEIPYDGIDNDCNGSDLVDVDGDTYPGISQADWKPQHDNLEWPPSVKTDPVDCNDDDNNVFPNKGTDPPYDGVDADCDCGNDFDVDGDGDVPAEYESAFNEFATTSCYTGATPTFGDCDDFDETANSSNTADGCGDGIDADCSGDNDYDCDDDGWMADSVSNTEFQQFLNRYHGGTAPAAWGASDWGDCDDDDDSVYPGATDPVGDGVDSDCGCNDGWDNDFDGDGDMWIPDGRAAALAAYAATWCSDQIQPIEGGEGDCDDTNAAVNPGQLETLGDAVDSDCSGANDSSPLTFGDLEWTSPRPPAVARTNGHYILVSSADAFADPPVAPFSDAVVAMAFDPASGPGDLPSDGPHLLQGAGTVYPIGASVDVTAAGDAFFTSYTIRRDNLTYALAVRYAKVGQTYQRGNTDSSAVSPYDNVAIDIELDSSGRPWVWSVGTDRLHVFKGDTTTQTDAGQSIALTSASTVFIDSATVGQSTGTVCDAAGCQSHTFDGNAIAVAGTQPWSGDAAISGSNIDGVVALADGSDGVIVDDGTQSNLILTGFPVAQARAALGDGGILYVAALADDAGTWKVKLVYGDPVTPSFTTVDIPIDASLTPTGVGMLVDTDRVFLAVSAEDGSGNDAVGWLFLGPA